MKRKILVLILCLGLVFLFGCGRAQTVDARVQVSLVETPGCTVENNGQWVLPGDNAVFYLEMEAYTSLSGTDYDGDYSAELRDGKLVLTLENIRYPVRVKPELTQDFCLITYEPNGGDGTATTKTYDLQHHLRPNTENGTELFTREGHTLVCWNTEPDGSGIRVGLGSRVTVDGSLTLYAQWGQWAPETDFDYQFTNFNTVNIRSYLGSDETVVIPERIEGKKVTAVMANAFQGSGICHVVVPPTVERIASDAFSDCKALESVVLYDNLHMIYDGSFVGCDNLQTLYINAVEKPYGYDFRKESAYADKIDMLMAAQGQKKMVFYGGCSVWYNLDGAMMAEAFGSEYTVLNMGLNGTVNSLVQMQILDRFLEEGDLLVHTLELTSKPQLLSVTHMADSDDKLWCGLEYNYDLFSLVDLRTVDGVFESWLNYLENKKGETGYQEYYTDGNGNEYMDAYGCASFYRDATRQKLTDKVELNPAYLEPTGVSRLLNWYSRWQDRGITVYLSYACVNMDEVPAEQQANVELMDLAVKEAFGGGPAVISSLGDFVYRYEDFYDTNYHLLSGKVGENTALWLRDLKARMLQDGLWEDAE